MARPREDVFDPIAILRALDQRRVAYIVIGALGRVIQGSDEVTDGIDIVPSTREDNLRKLGLALEDLNARRVDGKRLDFEDGLPDDLVLELETDAGGLGLGVGGVRNGSVVGFDVFAKCDAGHHLALVDGEVGVHLGSSRVARDENAVGNPQAVVRMELAVVESDTDRFEAKSIEWRRPSDREQDLVPLEGHPVAELDRVRAGVPCSLKPTDARRFVEDRLALPTVWIPVPTEQQNRLHGRGDIV